MKKILFFAVLGALGTTLFTSCSNEDALTPPSPQDKTSYSDAFKAKFGNSSFNTVKTVDVTAQIPQGKGNYTLRVYDGYPSAKSGAQMVGKFENLTAGTTVNKKVNCPGNAERLFFTVEKNGMSLVSNCTVKNNKVVARFEDGSETYSGIEGTFDLAWSDEYAQFSKAFYTGLPTALTTIAGLFNEGQDHRTAGADATFAFNDEGEVVFYPIFMNEQLNDVVGYFIYDALNEEIVEEGTLISDSQNDDFLWEGTADGPNAVYPKYQKGGLKFKSGNGYMYSQPYTVTVPQDYDGDPANLVVGITISNNQQNDAGESYSGIDGATLYSLSELNGEEGIQVAVYASGNIEIVNVTDEGEETTTGTFGLVGIEDNINTEGRYASDWDINDIVLYTEATQVTTVEFENPAKYFIAFEDLGGTYDFDFNDVVLEIDYVSGMEEGYVKCVAAGGILPVEVLYDGEAWDMTPRGQDDAVSIWGELHAAFGVDVQTVVNTIPEGTKVGNLVGATCEPLYGIFFFGEDFLIEEDGIPFYLVVEGEFGQKRIDARGEDGTPQAIVIGTTWTKYPDIVEISETQEITITPGENVTEPEFTYWQWPIECTAVDAAYPDINDWIADPANFDWLQTGVSSLLY